MPVNFSPRRQGSAHIIEQTDVVLARAPPRFRPGFGKFDTRICIRAHGLAERAMWFRHDKHHAERGIDGDIHLWTYWLSDAEVARVRECLAQVAELFRSFVYPIDANDSGVSMSFWSEGERLSAFLHLPGKQRAQYDQAQVFAYTLIASLVPQPPPFMDDLPS